MSAYDVSQRLLSISACSLYLFDQCGGRTKPVAYGHPSIVFIFLSSFCDLLDAPWRRRQAETCSDASHVVNGDLAYVETRVVDEANNLDAHWQVERT